MEKVLVELGPKMLACSERERLFVWAFLQSGGRNATGAAREAGYSDSGNGAIRRRGHLLVHRQRVREALREVGHQHFQGLFIKAVAAVEDMLDKPDHPEHVKTAFSVLSRLGLVERTGVDLNVSGEVNVNHTDQAVEDLRMMLSMGASREKLIEAFGYSGLPRLEKMLAEVDRRRAISNAPMIDGEVVG